MENRLAEKLKLAGGVVARQHKKIEDRADAIIAREADIEKKTDQAFLPHESMLDAAEKGLDGLERQLSGLSNDPLQSSQSGSVTDRKGDATTNPIVIKQEDVGKLEDVIPIAQNRQGRIS